MPTGLRSLALNAGRLEGMRNDKSTRHIPSGLFTDLVAHEVSLRRIESFDWDVVPSRAPAVFTRGICS